MWAAPKTARSRGPTLKTGSVCMRPMAFASAPSPYASHACASAQDHRDASREPYRTHTLLSEPDRS